MRLSRMFRGKPLCPHISWRIALAPLVFLLPLSAEICEYSGTRPELTAARAEQSANQAIIVVTVWEQEPPSRDLARCYESELRELMAELGMRTRFIGLSEATQSSFAGRIVVLRMTQFAEEARKSLPSIPSTALAWTHASGGDVTPFGAVDLEALSAFLQLSRFETETPHGVRVFGRALGRVAAHEIFHMITRTMVHSPRGLMQPELTCQELTSVRRLGWMPRDRQMAMLAFPQARVDAVIAAVQGNSQKHVQ